MYATTIEGENLGILKTEVDFRLSYLGLRARSKFVPHFAELYRWIEEECEPAKAVLESLGMGNASDCVGFSRFRQRCVRWGVWVSREEFARDCKLQFFDPTTVLDWRVLRAYVSRGMVPDLVRLGSTGNSVGRGGHGIRRGSQNRRRLRALPLENWVAQGFKPTEIFRFLSPFFMGLSWWQVYLHLSEVKARSAQPNVGLWKEREAAGLSCDPTLVSLRAELSLVLELQEWF